MTAIQRLKSFRRTASTTISLALMNLAAAPPAAVATSAARRLRKRLARAPPPAAGCVRYGAPPAIHGTVAPTSDGTGCTAAVSW